MARDHGHEAGAAFGEPVNSLVWLDSGSICVCVCVGGPFIRDRDGRGVDRQQQEAGSRGGFSATANNSDSILVTLASELMAFQLCKTLFT